MRSLRSPNTFFHLYKTLSFSPEGLSIFQYVKALDKYIDR